jgi:predicted transcriptional regulator
MDALEKRLRDELLRKPNVKLLETVKWTLPIQLFDIEYETVKRTKMDILMKMLLVAFRTSRFSSAEELSDMLVVEPLFITDIIDRMKRAGMIVKSDGGYTLTEIGKQRLEAGIYVHPPEKEEATVQYSATHGAFFVGELPDGTGESYRHAADDRKLKEMSDDEWRGALDQLNVAYEEGDVQLVVDAITSVKELERSAIPCFEFRLHQTSEDRLFVRVWNTMTSEWDETLETHLLERDLSAWREKYLKT